MKIGPISIEPPLALAPMAGVTNHPYRILAKECGCGLLFSEMVSARGLLHGSARSSFLLYFTQRERPIAIQIFGSEPEMMAEAARRIESLGADIVDLNLGCPTPKIVRNGDGGALMRDPGRCSAVFKAVVSAVSIPVTVKMRKGWDERSANAPEIAARAADAGIKAVTVHGRTVQQGYRGRADWDVIKQVKETVTVPVLGNGDVTSPQDARSMLDYCGCDGVMIGRAALGNPWIFAQVRTWLKEGREVPPPSPADRAAMALKHLGLLCALKGELLAVREMRRHAGWYIKGLPGAHQARQRLNQASSFVEMETVMRDLGVGLE